MLCQIKLNLSAETNDVIDGRPLKIKWQEKVSPVFSLPIMSFFPTILLSFSDRDNDFSQTPFQVDQVDPE